MLSRPSWPVLALALVAGGCEPPTGLSGSRAAPDVVAGVGSVRTVYAIPSNREPVQVYRDSVARAVRHLQRWYGEELGGVTFAVADTVPEVCRLLVDDEFLIRHDGTVSERWAAALESVAHCGPRRYDETFVWIVYFDVDEPCWRPDRPLTLGRGEPGLTMLGRWDLLGLTNPDLELPCGHGGRPHGRWVGGLGHELGHAFGLSHPPGCDESSPSCDYGALMAFGYVAWPDTYLRDDEKQFLRASRFFAER